MAEILSFSLEDFGISNKNYQLNKDKEEILKILLAASPKKLKAYLEVLKTIDKVLAE